MKLLIVNLMMLDSSGAVVDVMVVAALPVTTNLRYCCRYYCCCTNIVCDCDTLDVVRPTIVEVAVPARRRGQRWCSCQ
jgi:hypothetical protein